MGCCVSKKDFSSKGSAPPVQGPENRRDSVKEENSREPPPAPQEEETVKEVLSETPKPPLLVIPTGEKRIEKEPQRKPAVPAVPSEEKKFERRSSLLSSNDETSEMSEICSLTESMSTTITEKKEENGFEEVEMRPSKDYRSPAKLQRKRTLSGDYPGRRDRGGKSPARRSEPSPGRRTPGRERQTVTRSRISHKRDPGEDSGRRSRSPAVRRDPKGAATARNDLTRSASARKTGRAPPRLVAEDLANGTSLHPQLERAGDGGEAPANESLENPLVSLECFIFL